MFFLVIRKIWNNKWMMLCLLLGSALAVAMVASIPLYTDGILQRMIVKDMEAFQQKTNYYPGRYLARYVDQKPQETNTRKSTFEFFDGYMEGVIPELGVETLSQHRRLGMDYLKSDDIVAGETKYLGLFAMENFYDNIELTAGRMPAFTAVDGVYEVLIQGTGQSVQGYQLEKVYELSDNTRQMDPIKVKPVGIYKRIDHGAAYWYDTESRNENGMFMDFDLYLSDILGSREAITSAEWFFAVDYQSIKIDRLVETKETLASQIAGFTKYAGTEMSFHALEVLDEYAVRESQLRVTLWVLQAPILILLAFYMFMVSQLIVENDKNEIAVLKSRGASNLQIFSKYLLQSALLSGVAIIIGPFLAFGICRILGASNGFLEFIGRTALPLTLRPRTIYYAIAAGAFSVVMMMIPAMMASRTTVVEHKQKSARRWKAPLWQKFFLDFVLLGVSMYGLFSYQTREQTILVAGGVASDAPIDPFLFIISTLFVLGAGLLFLRVYPYIIRFLAWAGRKIWSPVIYTSFIQVGRSTGREQFLMLFLILTIAVGVFNANSARTINQNVEDQVGYAIGADITLQMTWPGMEKNYGPDGGGAGPGVDITVFSEPDYNHYNDLDGTDYATRVLRTKEYTAYGGNNTTRGLGTHLMAIDTYDFGHVVWYRNGVLPHHINEYLNLLGSESSAVLISTNLAKELGLNVGDSISFRRGSSEAYIQAIVYSIIGYWPTFNPETDAKNFIVANFDFIRAQSSLQPYQIWYSKADDATSAQVYADIEERKMILESYNDLTGNITTRKNDPLLQGTNGAMTLGFVVTMAISMIGFIIYWILSIQARTLQFGILRAMGMRASKVMGMIAFEQVLISGVAIFVGLLIGGLMSELFVPLLGVAYGTTIVPPFQVVAHRADYIKLYTVIGAMLVSGFALLGILVNRIKVAQAIKLGED